MAPFSPISIMRAADAPSVIAQHGKLRPLIVTGDRSA